MLWFRDGRTVTEPVGPRHSIATRERHRHTVDTASITASRRYDDIVVSVDGVLGAASARTLLDVVQRMISTGEEPLRVEVDLRRMRSCTTAGVTALASCARLGDHVSRGLCFRVGTAGGTRAADG
jgi:hypothetical protein